MQKQVVSIPFATGQKDKTGDAWLDAGANTTVTNGIFVKTNTIQKRPGIKVQGTTEVSSSPPYAWAGNVTKALRLAPYKNDLLLYDGQYVRSRIAKLDAWEAKDEACPVVATRETISQLTYQVTDADVAEVNGYRVFVWADKVNFATATYFTIQEVSTGAIVAGDYVAGGSATHLRPKLVPISSGSVVVLVYQRTSDNALVGRSMDLTTTPAWSAETVLVAGAATKASVAFDAVYVTGTAAWMLAYEDNLGVIQLRIFTSAFLGIGSGACTDPNTTYTAISLRADNAASGLVWLAFSYGGGGVNVKMATHSYPSLAQSTAPFTVDLSGAVGGANIGIEQLDATHAVVVYGIYAGSSSKYRWGVFSSAGTNTLPVKTGFHQAILSRPILINSLDSVYGVRAYVLVNYQDSSFACTSFLVELDVRNDTAGTGIAAAHPVATLSPRFAATSSDRLRSSSSLANSTVLGVPSSTSCVVPCTVAQSLGGNGVMSLSASTFDWAHPGAFTTIELGEETYVSGGVPSVFDGSRLYEIGFLGPTYVSSLSAAAGGSLAATQTYSYIIVPEWRDRPGSRVFGQPSLPFSATTSAPNKLINGTYNNVPLTTKADPYTNPNLNYPYYAIYRTVFAGGVMGTTYHNITDYSLPIPNVNPGADTWSFQDDGVGTKSDATAAGAEVLYITGGVVESDCPSSFTTACAHQGRWLGVGDDQRTIWFSTQSIPGQTVRFNDAFTLTCEEGGPITAIASLEGNLIVFKSDSIYYFTGTGPNELGDQNSFTGPIRLPTDIGCTGPRGTLLTPQGIVFRTRTGMALLDRGMGIHSEFGDAVDNLAGVTGCQIAAANIHPTRPEYWFEIPSTTSASETVGSALVYNYQVDAWTVQQRYDSTAALSSAFMNCATVVNGVYYCGTPSGHTFSEYPLINAGTAGQYKDGGTASANWITLSIETPWLKPSMVEGATKTSGYGRANKFNFLEEWYELHDIQIRAAYDYDTAYQDLQVYQSSYHTVSTQSLEEVEVRLVRPKCEAVRIKWSDAPPTGGGTATVGIGGAPTAITAEIGVYSGTNRITSSRRH